MAGRVTEKGKPWKVPKAVTDKARRPGTYQRLGGGMFLMIGGRDGALVCATPPSEPDGRISRIRLSSQWFYLLRGRLPRPRALRNRPLGLPCGADALRFRFQVAGSNSPRVLALSGNRCGVSLPLGLSLSPPPCRPSLPRSLPAFVPEWRSFLPDFVSGLLALLWRL